MKIDLLEILLLGALAQLAATASQAETLQLSGNQRWLALASDRDKDVAIGIARHEAGRAGVVKVISSKSGYYGVIAGPYKAKTIQDLKKNDKDSMFADLPQDALMSRGDNYTATVWEAPKGKGIGLAAFALDKPAQFSSGQLQVTVSAQKLSTENAYTVIDGKDAQGTFHFDIGKDLPKDELATAEEFTGLNYNNAGVAQLVPATQSPQVIVTNYSGGAHCCTTTYFMSRDQSQGAWLLSHSPALDGDGYSYEDVDGDGALELISSDNAFLYAFESYAGSAAPIKISELRGGKIEDVSEAPAMHARLVQDMAGLDYDAKVRPEFQKSNGFLAAWVASKIRLGQGDAAWASFMKTYDKESTFGPQVCTSGQKQEDCPVDNLKPIPIPKALAQFLKDNGYGPLPKAAEAELK
jgi:hypothetical protein